MPRLSKRDKLEILVRNPEFMADLKELNRPLTLQERISPEVWEQRDRIRSKVCKVWGNPHASPEGITQLLDRFRQASNQRESYALEKSLTHAVKPIPQNTIRSGSVQPDQIQFLREGRFLTLELDLGAATIEDLEMEVGEYIRAFRPKGLRVGRKRKSHSGHEAIKDLDPWVALKQHEDGQKPYAIAKAFYREHNRGSLAGFSDNADSWKKAASAALKAAQLMISSLPYPPEET